MTFCKQISIILSTPTHKFQNKGTKHTGTRTHTYIHSHLFIHLLGIRSTVQFARLKLSTQDTLYE